MVVNSMQKQASRDLAVLQTSPDLQAAHQAASEATEAVNQAQREILRANDTLSEHSLWPGFEGMTPALDPAFREALDRIAVDDSGEFVLKGAGLPFIKPAPYEGAAPEKAAQMQNAQSIFDGSSSKQNFHSDMENKP